MSHASAVDQSVPLPVKLHVSVQVRMALHQLSVWNRSMGGYIRLKLNNAQISLLAVKRMFDDQLLINYTCITVLKASIIVSLMY